MLYLSVILGSTSPVLAKTNLYKLYQIKAMQPGGEFFYLAHNPLLLTLRKMLISL